MRKPSRLFVGIMICVALALGSIPAYADYASSERWFNSLSTEERGLVQSHLILLGHYGSMSDATFGNYTYRALTAFQRERGYRQDGVLTSSALQALIDASDEIYADLGIDLVRDERGQMALLMPDRLLSRRAETKRGTAYFTPDDTIRLETIRKPFTEQSYEALYQTLAAETPSRRVTYKYLGPETFVVSGTRAGRSFYIFMNNGQTDSAGFSIEWDSSRTKLASTLAVFVASHSYPLAFAAEDIPAPSTQAAPQNAPSPQPMPSGSSSGTGFFVADGVLVTNHHVIDRCAAIEVVGYGAAKVITSDSEVDLAVLQLHAPQNHPMAEIRNTPADLGEDVIALGFPLASLLNSSLNVGTGIVSAENGLLGEPRWFTTNVGIQPGNSGGPILDDRGRVLGVAVAKINDEALLASIGTTAPNVGFAIKSDTLADYLGIFRLPTPNEPSATPMTTRELVELGRQFTVQVVCNYPGSGMPNSQAAAPSPSSTGSVAELPSGYRWVVFASAKDPGNLPAINHIIYPQETVVALSENGNYALIAGPFMEATAAGLLAKWSSNTTIPDDAYLSSGRRFLHIVE